jgi:hypothetical protein
MRLAAIGKHEWVILLLVVAGAAFWCWMLIECVKREKSEGSSKLAWILVVLLGGFLGALVYFFVRRPARIRESGA